MLDKVEEYWNNQTENQKRKVKCFIIPSAILYFFALLMAYFPGMLGFLSGALFAVGLVEWLEDYEDAED